MFYYIPSQPVKFIFEITFFTLILLPTGILWVWVKKCLPVEKKSVKGQVILITGAAGALGRKLALLFADLGAKIVCLDINEKGNDETARMVRETGAVAASYKCDISKRDQIKDMHQRVKEEIGPVDILINNAAIVWGHIYIDPTKEQLIDDIIDVNLKGQFWMNREILQSMLDRNSGHIVAISSIAAIIGIHGISSYTATKFAINGMMESLRDEIRQFGTSSIKMTTVMPYFMNTNPAISERLDCRFPEIPLEIASKIIVSGILEEKQIFSVPHYLYLLITIIKWLPDNLQNVLNKIMYVRFQCDDKEQLIVKRYQNKSSVFISNE